MGRKCNMHGERRGTNAILMGNPKSNSPLGDPRSRLENNIKMDLGDKFRVEWD
jgi:hypothetical protein